MTLSEVIRLVSARLSALNGAKATAESLGNLQRVLELEEEIAETQSTLNSLSGIAG